MAVAICMAHSNESISVLLGSGGIATETRRETYRKMVSEHFSDCKEVLFVPFASDDHDSYTSRMQDFMGEGGPRLRWAYTHTKTPFQPSARPMASTLEGQLVLADRGPSPCGSDRAGQGRGHGGVPYLGVSAGANVACPTMMTTNDMPIVLPPSFESFGIVPFQVNPHYHPGKVFFMDGDELAKHYGESRSQRIAEFHRHQSTPVLGMWEGSFVKWDGSRGVLTGRATAFIAREGQIEMDGSSDFNSELLAV